MNIEKNIEYIAEQLFEKGNLEVADKAFDVDYIAHDGDKIYKGQKFVKQFIKKIRLAFPDIKISSIEFLSQTEDTLTWQRTFTGTHKADMYGVYASGKKLKWNEIIVSRLHEGIIIEEWVVSNLAFEMMLARSK